VPDGICTYSLLGVHLWSLPNNLQMLLFFYCGAGWGYIVAFTKVLAMYQIYHTWIDPLHCSLSSPPSHSWNSFNKYNFCKCFYFWVGPRTRELSTTLARWSSNLMLFEVSMAELCLEILKDPVGKSQCRPLGFWSKSRPFSENNCSPFGNKHLTWSSLLQSLNA
jgi:hypothetical protein